MLLHSKTHKSRLCNHLNLYSEILFLKQLLLFKVPSYGCKAYYVIQKRQKYPLGSGVRPFSGLFIAGEITLLLLSKIEKLKVLCVCDPTILLHETVYWVALLLYVREIRVSNLDLQTDYCD
jgi:hypothetical protein